jgi:hypothetical protein
VRVLIVLASASISTLSMQGEQWTKTIATQPHPRTITGSSPSDLTTLTRCDADLGPDVSSYTPVGVCDNHRSSIHIHALPINVLLSIPAWHPKYPFLPSRPTPFLFVTTPEHSESDIPFPRSSTVPSAQYTAVFHSS